MNKRYEYNGMIYCEDDLSEEIKNYGGDLYSFYCNLQQEGKACEITLYYLPCIPENAYEDYEELIENEFYDYEVKKDE